MEREGYVVRLDRGAGRPRSLQYCQPMMIHHLRAQLDAFRLGVHQRDLRRREQDALARLGKMTLGEGGTRVGRLAALAPEAAAYGAGWTHSRGSAGRRVVRIAVTSSGGASRSSRNCESCTSSPAGW